MQVIKKNFVITLMVTLAANFGSLMANKPEKENISSIQSQNYIKELKNHFFLERIGYSLNYDGRLRQATWVIEELTKDSITGNVKRANYKFSEDIELPECVRSTLKDYAKSGYDRGHLAPAADHRSSPAAMKDTFLLSNMSPQNSLFNRGYWANLEKHVRVLAEKHGKVIAITGPLFLPKEQKNGKKIVSYEVIGPNDVAVPTHYFKIIISNHFDEAYILPNEHINSKTSLEDFKTTIDKIEKLSGIFFGRS